MRWAFFPPKTDMFVVEFALMYTKVKVCVEVFLEKGYKVPKWHSYPVTGLNVGKWINDLRRKYRRNPNNFCAHHAEALEGIRIKFPEYDSNNLFVLGRCDQDEFDSEIEPEMSRQGKGLALQRAVNPGFKK